MDDDSAVIGERLRTARDEAQARVAALTADLRDLFEASRTSNADDEHDPEGATIAFERAQLTALLEAARRQVTDLDAAMERLRSGRYGRCERCSQPIPADRLVARPTAVTCVACAGLRRT